jgi:hypothetical protein
VEFNTLIHTAQRESAQGFSKFTTSNQSIAATLFRRPVVPGLQGMWESEVDCHLEGAQQQTLLSTVVLNAGYG